MRKFLLEHQGQMIEFPIGEYLIGRGMGCRVRFNDPAISRMHLRLLVSAEGMIIQDLGSSNGTRVNGQRCEGAQRLEEGDVLVVGHRKLTLHVIDDMDEEKLEQTISAVSGSGAWLAGQEGSVPLELPERDEIEESLREESDTPSFGVPSIAPPIFLDADEDIAVHNCPRCRAEVPFAEDVCPECDYEWPAGRPFSQTVRIDFNRVGTSEPADRRRAPRVSVDLPVLYCSDSLTFEASARDLSDGGMYVNCELLDPIGTRCKISVLPDGHPAVHFEGMVCHVVQTQAGEGGRPPGLGIKFTSISAESQRWLEDALTTARPIQRKT